MKVCVLGCTGMLGSELTRVLLTNGFDVVGTFRDYDKLKALIATIPSSFLRGFSSESFMPEIQEVDFDIPSRADVYINCIGNTKPDISTLDPDSQERAIFINSFMPRKLANMLATADSNKFIHITTDCVFLGKDIGLHYETSLHDCTDLYGRSKSLGEPDNAFVLRTSIIGRELTTDKHLVSWVARHSIGSEVDGYFNHWWNGLTTNALSKVICQIIKEKLYTNFTLQHIFSPTVYKKSELVQFISNSLDLKLKVTAVEAPISCNRALGTVHPEFLRKLDIPEIKDQIL